MCVHVGVWMDGKKGDRGGGRGTKPEQTDKCRKIFC